MLPLHSVRARLALSLIACVTIASCKGSTGTEPGIEQSPPAGDVGSPSVPATAPAQPQSLGPNSLFQAPDVALQRQRQHNNFFTPETILDLQTNAYARTDRPEGLNYDVFHAVGHGASTATMIVGPKTDRNVHRRVVILDVLENDGGAPDAVKQLLKIYNAKRFHGGDHPVTKLPISAIIYSHNHLDHTGGIGVFLSGADQPACPAQDPSIRGLGGKFTDRPGCVDIIAQENLIDAVVNTSTVSGQIIQARSFYMYGAMLPVDGTRDEHSIDKIGRTVTMGVGPPIETGTSAFRLPSRTFADKLHLTAAGVSMDLVYVPSEANDELIAFLPDNRNMQGQNNPSQREVAGEVAGGGDRSGLLFSAEVIQGPAYPNLYSLRGTQYRSPATWFRGVDVLRKYDAWCMLPGHGPPVCGRSNVQLLLTNFRDAIQYTHDQTVRLMNKGYLPEEMARMVQVPEVLTEELTRNLATWPNKVSGSFGGRVHPADYLVPFYGSVPQSVRVIYQGYLGWYQGDPWQLWPTPRDEAARRLAVLAGRETTLTDAAKEALNANDWVWAAELATLALEANPADSAAKKAKIDAYTALGHRAVDPNWSHWFYMSANELKDNSDCFAYYVLTGLIGPEVVANIPVSNWVDSWMVRYKGDELVSSSTVFGFWIDPTDFGSPGYILRERHGIVEVEQWSGTEAGFLAQIDVGLKLTYDDLHAAILSTAGEPKGNVPQPISIQEALLTAIDDGDAQVIKGGLAAVEEFFGHFEGVLDCQPTMSAPRSSALSQMATREPVERAGRAGAKERTQQSPNPMALRTAPRR